MKCSSPYLQNSVNNILHCSTLQKKVQILTESNVAFKGVVSKPAPFLASTNSTLQNFYTNYQKSLSEISLQEISKIVKELIEETGYSRKDILYAMQKLTQFASMNSLLNIAEITNKYGVLYIGLYDEILAQNDLKKIYTNYSDEVTNIIFDKANTNIFLSYLYRIKDLFNPRENKEAKIAYFLDNNSINNIEILQQKDPLFFKKFIGNKNIKFFLISGWETGINFADRTKNLKETTRIFLNNCKKNGMSIDNGIDSEILHKIKKIGISPIVISKEGLATENCIYRQMAPDKMTKDELFHVIDTVSQEKTTQNRLQIITKDILAKYIHNYFKIYTPEKYSLILKKLHNDITNYAKKLNISPKDIIYLQSETVKSFVMIAYMYKTINNIPDNQFVRVRDILLNNNIKNNKLVVFLDDCTLSGESLKTFSSEILSLLDEQVRLVFAFVCGTKKAIDSFPKSDRVKLLVGDIVNYINLKNYYNVLLKKILGKSMFSSSVSSGAIILQKSPDNNTMISTILYYLHDFVFRKNNKLKTKNNNNTNSSERYIAQVTQAAKNSMIFAGEKPIVVSDRKCERIINSNIFKFIFRNLYNN